MGVVFKRNFPALDGAPLMTREDWAALGRLARERIIRRTVQGVDVEGNAFAPYSEGYAKQRERNNVAAARVTLQLSGEMLRSIEVIASDDGVELTF